MSEQRTIDQPATEKRVISKAQYQQLIGLKALADQWWRNYRELESAAIAITGEDDNCGHTCDMLADSRTVDECLELLKVRVRK